MFSPPVEWLLGGLSRWRYQLEKGQPHLKLFVGLTGAMLLLILAGGLVLYVGGVTDTPADGMWWVFLHLSDPGYLGGDAGPVATVVGTFMTVAGIVVFTSGIIAIITDLLSSSLAELAEGGHDVAFDHHIVIIGWSEKLFSLVFELLQADRSNDIVILGQPDKSLADNELERRVFAPFDRHRRGLARLRMWEDPRRSVVYRQGSALVEADLVRVGAARASRFILLSADGGRGMAGDVQMLREYLTVRAHRLRLGGDLGEHDHKRGRFRFSCVVEITQNRLREHVFLAAGLDPRADAWVADAMRRDPDRHDAVPDLPPPDVDRRDDLTLVNGDELITRALVQCAVQPRISGVYDSLLSFAGRDLMVIGSHELQQALGDRDSAARWEALRLRLESDQLPDADVLVELARQLRDVHVLGAMAPQAEGGSQLLFDPADWRRRLPTGDIERDRREGRLALIAVGDSVRTDLGHRRRQLALRAQPLPAPAPSSAPAADVAPQAPARRAGQFRVLILGSNRRLGVLIEQFAAYTEQYDQLDLALTIVDPDLPDDLSTLLHQRAAIGFCASAIQALRQDFSEWSVMRSLLADAPGEGRAYDSVVLLSEDARQEGLGADARVVLGLVMLRAFRSDQRWAHRLDGTSVAAEILDPENRTLFEHQSWVTDVIVTNQYVSRFAAQMAHDVRVEDLYRDLFDFGGCEIYVRPLSSYAGPAPLRFLDLVAVASQRGEVALGYLHGEADGSTRPVVAPDPAALLDHPVGVLVVADR